MIAFALAVAAAAAVAFAAASVARAAYAAPDRARLARDLRWLASAAPPPQAEFRPEDVVRYYEATTFRDYRLLALATGSDAMHTKLPPGAGLSYDAGCLHQLLYVIAHAGGARSVLEVGCGKGSNSVFLASLFPSARFVAVDLVPAHVRHAARRAREAGVSNVEFVLGDASSLPGEVAGRRYDLVFGVESLCHLDTPAKRSGFMRVAADRLTPGGKLVIADGFRSGRFAEADPDAREAMRAAEAGFRIAAMPSKECWSALGELHGLRRAQDVDLTREALAFWTRGWRAARLLLLLAPSLVRRCLRSGDPSLRETGANFSAVLMTAYALALGSAEYGVLALEKPAAGAG